MGTIACGSKSIEYLRKIPWESTWSKFGFRDSFCRFRGEFSEREMMQGSEIYLGESNGKLEARRWNIHNSWGGTIIYHRPGK